MRVDACMLALTFLAAASGVTPAVAQRAEPEARPQPWRIGVALVGAQPRGDFGHVLDRAAWGGTLNGSYRLDAAGIFALRADAGILNYGREERRVMLSPTVGGRIQLDLRTTNDVAFFHVGPEIALPLGPVRPYAALGLGVIHLATNSALSSTESSDSFARTTHLSDWTRSLVGAAGLRAPVYRGRSQIAVDAGVRYQNNGEARYLREGDITDNPDGTISFTPHRTDTDMLVMQLGVSIVPGR
ncbi:MAG: hypothetical protein ACRELD_12045 [Longimicrobiales bacterium]